MGCITSKHVVVSVTPAVYNSVVLSSWSQDNDGLGSTRKKQQQFRSDSEKLIRREYSFQKKELGEESGRKANSISFRLGNFHKYAEGEQVAAGWPAWLSAVAGEAINGWVPLKADSYEKLEKIGQGTYSSVFRARDVETGRIVALKKVRFDNFEPESVRFMAREILILRRLNHKNIVKLEGLITSRLSCNLYLVFEYMEHDLAGLTASPDIKFSEPQIKCYMKQLLSALDHCHSRGIMHRDIKGANLLVNNEGILKMADFGLANHFVLNQKQPLTSRVVTLWYRPPELLLGATNYGPAVDLWSVGCVFAEMLLGKPLLQGRTEVEQLHKIFKLCGSPPEEYWKKAKVPHATVFRPQHPYDGCLRETFKHLPDVTLGLIETLLSVDPQKRGSAAAALELEYFKTEPYACEPSSLPKYPPNKEIDAKCREDEARRRRLGIRGGRGSEVFRKGARVAKGSDGLSRFAPRSQILQGDAHGSHQGNAVKVNPLNGNNIDHHRHMQSNGATFSQRPIHRRHVSEEDIPFSGPLPLSTSNGFTWAKLKKENSASLRSQRRSSSRSQISGSSEFSVSMDSRSLSGMKDHEYGKPVRGVTSSTRSVFQPGHYGHPSSFDAASDSDRSQEFSATLYQRETAYKPNMGYRYQVEKVDFSGPILSQSSNIDELLEKHERHIRQAVRWSWFSKGRRHGKKEMGQ